MADPNAPDDEGPIPLDPEPLPDDAHVPPAPEEHRYGPDVPNTVEGDDDPPLPVEGTPPAEPPDVPLDASDFAPDEP